MPSKIRVSAKRYSLKSSTMQRISFGSPKKRLARSKLTGLWSTTVTLLPWRASIVARLPPPHPRSRTLFASLKNASIIFTYGKRLSGRRALALENLAFAIVAVARLFAFPDRDLAQLAFVFAEDLQSYSRVNCDVSNISNDL